MTDDAEIVEPIKFEQNINVRLNDLRQENQCCDVRFEISGKIFPCHRVVMIAASPYFETMFNGNFKESGSDIISLKDIEAETFEEILNAIYTGSIRLLPSNAYTFLKASHLLLLDSVQDVCISYIKTNCDSVHYLVEIFLFCKEVPRLQQLHATCRWTISSDLIRYGQTDFFVSIPLDSFRNILVFWQPESYEEEFTIQLISKWGKENKASCGDVQKLILASGLKFSRFLNPALMAQFITSSYGTCVEMKNQICEKMDLDVSFDLNVYLNTVDVKTGEKGWSVLKITDTFNTYVVSSFHPTSSKYKSVCRVGSKIYCFEYFGGKRQRNVFSCFDENNVKILLPTPKQLLKIYQMSSKDTSVYLMAEAEKRFLVWAYDCDLKSWKKIVKESDTGEYDTVSAYAYLNRFFYVILNENGDETLFSIDSDSFVIKKILIEWRSTADGYMLCGFDNKLVLCNMYHNNFCDIDFINITSEQWMTEFSEEDMKFHREKFCLTYHSRFVYVVENDRTVGNEKFNLETDTWEELPSLPKRVTLANGLRELATGSVFSIDSEAMKK